MKTVGEYLKEKRDQKGYSLREMGSLAGISHTHIKDIEDSNREPTFKLLMDVISALSIDMNDFLQQTGYLPKNVEPAKMKKLTQVPVISWETAGEWHKVGGKFSFEDAEELIESDVRGKNVFALRCKGDAMEPEFHEQDSIIVNPDAAAKPGDFVIVKDNQNGEVLFRQLKKYGETTVLHPLNPKYQDIEMKKKSRHRIIGKVVKKEKRY